MRGSGLLLSGCALTILGCFLPWRGEGDFTFYRTPGIELASLVWIPRYDWWLPTFTDHGGWLIVLLALAVAVITALPALRSKGTRIALLLASLQGLLALYHGGVILIDRANAGSVIGPPTLQFGLLVVLAGALIQAWASRSVPSELAGGAASR